MKQIVLDSDMINNYNIDNKKYNPNNTNSNTHEKNIFLLFSVKNQENINFNKKKPTYTVNRQSFKSKNLSLEKTTNYRESLPQMGVKSNTSKHSTAIDQNESQFFKNGRSSNQKRFYSKYENQNTKSTPQKNVGNDSFHTNNAPHSNQLQQNKFLTLNNRKIIENSTQQKFNTDHIQLPDNQNKLQTFNPLKMNNFVEKDENGVKKEGFKRTLPKKVKQLDSNHIYGESEDINRLRTSTPHDKIQDQYIRLSIENKTKNGQLYLANNIQIQKNALNQYVTKIDKGDIFIPQQNLLLQNNDQKKNYRKIQPPNLDSSKHVNLQNAYLNKNIRSFSSYSKSSKNQSKKINSFTYHKEEIENRKPLNSLNSMSNHSEINSFLEKNIDLNVKQTSFFEQEKFQYYLSSVQYSYKPPFSTDHYSETFRQHFVQTCQGIQYGQIAQPADSDFLIKNKIHLGENTSKYETLIHCNESNLMPADVFLPIIFPTGDKVKAGINIRPYCQKILEELSKEAEIIVFTASHQCYANRYILAFKSNKSVIDYIDEKKNVKFRFFRENCVQTQQGVYVKDLRIFGDRQLKDMVLIDNASYSYGFQVSNGIPIIPFYERKDDQELKHLLHYLKMVILEKDVKIFNEKHLKLSLFIDPQGPQNVYQKLFLNNQQ